MPRCPAAGSAPTLTLSPPGRCHAKPCSSCWAGTWKQSSHSHCSTAAGSSARSQPSPSTALPASSSTAPERQAPWHSTACLHSTSAALRCLLRTWLKSLGWDPPVPWSLQVQKLQDGFAIHVRRCVEPCDVQDGGSQVDVQDYLRHSASQQQRSQLPCAQGGNLHILLEAAWQLMAVRALERESSTQVLSLENAL